MEHARACRTLRDRGWTFAGPDDVYDLGGKTPWVDACAEDEDSEMDKAQQPLQLTFTVISASLLLLTAPATSSSSPLLPTCAPSTLPSPSPRYPLFTPDPTSSGALGSAFASLFTTLDRFRVQEAVKDVLLMYRPTFGEKEAVRGDVRAVAENVYAAVSPVLLRTTTATTTTTDTALTPSICAHALTETLLTLLLSSYSPLPSSLPHPYLSRTLVELTKLRPSEFGRTVPAAIQIVIDDLNLLAVPARYAAADFAGFYLYSLMSEGTEWPFWKRWEGYITVVGGGEGEGEEGKRKRERMKRHPAYRFLRRVVRKLLALNNPTSNDIRDKIPSRFRDEFPLEDPPPQTATGSGEEGGQPQPQPRTTDNTDTDDDDPKTSVSVGMIAGEIIGRGEPELIRETVISESEKLALSTSSGVSLSTSPPLLLVKGILQAGSLRPNIRDINTYLTDHCGTISALLSSSPSSSDDDGGGGVGPAALRLALRWRCGGSWARRRAVVVGLVRGGIVGVRDVGKRLARSRARTLAFAIAVPANAPRARGTCASAADPLGGRKRKQARGSVHGVQDGYRRVAERRQVDPFQRADPHGCSAGSKFSVLHDRAECR